ncbi:MAG TPA: Mrp/NBP35 family ATP-binding protein, partial [Ardenticatenaceae bacterium]|nr:Mrp/NBP35 family ATP-binding protein [Ardenticatenaceae bacterium]
MFGFGKKKEEARPAVTESQVRAALARVVEPDLHRDLVTLNMVRDISINAGSVGFTVVLTTPAHPRRAQIESDCRRAVLAIPGVQRVDVHFTADVARDNRVTGKLAAPIRNVVAVASGKGGVGKSTVSVNLAIALAQEGAKVGLLDADIYGPNIPMMMGESRVPLQANSRVIPNVAYGVKLMSIGFIVSADQPIIWRGPMLHTALRQFLNDVDWGDLDYLIVDMPPGTGDVQLSLAQSTPMSGGLIVTTPQDVAVADARKGLAAFEKLDVPSLGIVENMSYFIAPDTAKRYHISGNGGGRRYAAQAGVPFLG